MNKYLTFILCVLLPLLFGCSKTKTSREDPVNPNIVIILSDDQGWGDLSNNGNGNLSTPNIDRLASEGATFDRFYVSPVCSPTRAELLTGRYHVRGGVYSTSAGGERLDLDETTFAEVFRDAGYATAAFGKWHNGMQYPYHPNARGFDEFYGFCSGHWGNYFDPVLEHNGELVRGNGYLTDDLTGKAMEFIELHKDRPFLVYLPYNTPHSPMQVPDKWWSKFKNMDLSYRNRNPESEDIHFTKAALAMCENIDWNVGRVLTRLEDLGLAENTIVVYFSDNGPNSWRWNGDMKGRKGSTDEGGVRSPLSIRWPNHIEAGRMINQISADIDLFPTLAELSGIGIPDGKPLDGKSLKPLLLDENPHWENRLIINHWRGRTSVRSQQYRLDYENHLFDMGKDPGQRSDISSNNPDVLEKLIAAKRKWEAEVLRELPKEDTRTFPIGHPDFTWTQVPARDGIATGNIQRSNRWPNCSFFTNWTSTPDSIYWNAEVMAEGNFEVTLYYTCREEDLSPVIQLSFGKNKIQTRITEAHDPPLTGMENDRVERIESYVKDFKPLDMGRMHLEKGNGQLVLKAIEIPGEEAIDFRLMMFKRVD